MTVGTDNNDRAFQGMNRTHDVTGVGPLLGCDVAKTSEATQPRGSLFDRLRQPDNLVIHYPGREIHGFASPPLDRFAFIVCNRLFKELLLTKEQCEFIST
jgi:hypothetical protein